MKGCSGSAGCECVGVVSKSGLSMPCTGHGPRDAWTPGLHGLRCTESCNPMPPASGTRTRHSWAAYEAPPAPATCSTNLQAGGLAEERRAQQARRADVDGGGGGGAGQGGIVPQGAGVQDEHERVALQGGEEGTAGGAARRQCRLAVRSVRWL